MLSHFTDNFFPYLFGVCIGQHPSILTSFHEINGNSVTLHRALFSLVKEEKELPDDLNWLEILEHITCGIELLHCKYNFLHNDLKCDNIVLMATDTATIRPVIIDFGKVSKGKLYNLTPTEKKQYAAHHPHIAPDLRDGRASDIFSLFEL